MSLNTWKNLGVTPDIDTLEDCVSLADPQMAVHKLQDYGLSVNMVLSPVLAVMLKAGHIYITWSIELEAVCT
jgi:hypothetical protein